MLLLIFFCRTAYAGEVISSYVDHNDDRYVVEVDMLINAQVDTVYALITAYNKLGQLNSSIEKSELIHSLDSKNHRVLVVSDVCVLFFCKTITQLQDIQEISKELIKFTKIRLNSSAILISQPTAIKNFLLPITIYKNPASSYR